MNCTKSKCILTINSGSSSLKFSVYRGNVMVLGGQFDRINTKDSCRVKIRNALGTILAEQPVSATETVSHSVCLSWLIKFLMENDIRIGAVGHRIVHGGLKYVKSVLISEAILADLEALTQLAPLHQPHNLAGIRACQEHLVHVPQIACFDTAFHRDRPMIDRLYGIDKNLAKRDGVIAYGFHGLSYTYIAERLAQMTHASVCQKVIVCHLGNGASICGMVDGQGVTSSMGFTALDGLIMGTRCGSIDPGVVLHLVEKMGLENATNALYKGSGLLGLSGISSDMRDLERAALNGSIDAIIAIEKFSWSVVREIGSMLPNLKGLDTIVFTAGIGEKSAYVRDLICKKLSWLGLQIDSNQNSNNAIKISLDSSQIAVYVIPTDEESIIARDTQELAFA